MFGLDTLFHKLLFGIISTVANIVDILINFIRMVLGLSPLEGSDPSNSGGKTDFLQGIIQYETVTRAFWIVVLIAVSFLFVFAIIRTIKAQMNEKEGGAGVAKAMRGIIEAFAHMILLPTFVVLVVLAASVTAIAVDNATHDSQNGVGSYSTEIVFSTVVQGSLTDEGKKWYNGESGYEIYDSYGNRIEKMAAVKLVYTGWDIGAPYYSDAACTRPRTSPLSGSDFKRLTALVDEDIYFDSFILPMLGSFAMMASLAMAGITIAQRLFTVVFMLIIAPLTASVRPLDDGARFKKWSEIFLGKALGGYGIIFALNIFFSIAPSIVANTFFASGVANSVARLVVYVAGVSFATGANVLVGQLIGSDAGASERDAAAQNMRSMTLGTAGTLFAIRGASRLAFGRRNRGLAGAVGGTGASGISGTIGGAMGAAGMSLASGSGGGAAKKLGTAAKKIGTGIATRSPIGRTAVGGAMLAGGLLVGAGRSTVQLGKKIGGAAKSGYLRTFGRNTAKGKEFAEQMRQAKILKTQKAYQNAKSSRQFNRILQRNLKKDAPPLPTPTYKDR